MPLDLARVFNERAAFSMPMKASNDAPNDHDDDDDNDDDDDDNDTASRQSASRIDVYRAFLSTVMSN